MVGRLPLQIGETIYPVHVSPLYFWGGVLSATASALILSIFITFSFDSWSIWYTLAIIAVAVIHVVPVIIFTRKIRIANIAFSPKGVKFTIPQSFDFVAWRDVLNVDIDRNDLVIEVWQQIAPPVIRRRRKLRLRLDGQTEAYDLARRYLNEHESPDQSAMHVRPPDL